MKVNCTIILVTVVVAGLLAAPACSNKKTAVPGKPCVINSDCHDPLSCSFGTCHEACRENGDCAAGGLCVFDKTRQGVGEQIAEPLRICVLPVDDQMCLYNSVCSPGLVCGRDLHCRNECLDNVDCVNPDDKCVVGGPNGVKVCAEPAAVGTNGELVSAPPDGGAGGASGAGGAGGDAGRDLHADGGVDRLSVAAMEPNEDPTTATPFTPGTQVTGRIEPAGDIDYYMFDAPAGDLAGGYYQGSFTNVGAGPISFKVISATDNGVITALQDLTVGISRYFFWAAAPGQKYYLAVAPLNSAVFNYTLIVDYTPVIDDYEPNDVRQQAKTIGVGTPVTASFFTGFKSSTITTAELQDWYLVDLPAGPTSIAVTGVPETVALAVLVTNAATNVNVGVTNPRSPNVGGAFTSTFTIATAGMYHIQIGLSGLPPAYVGTALGPVPDHFTRQYQLLVTQP